MDDRLIRGRQLIVGGEKSIRNGSYDEARGQFHSALMQFRGPELMLGEAHVLRGLARVDLEQGQVERAEVQARDAIKVYGLVRSQMVHIDNEAVTIEFKHDAEEGEAVSYVLLGEVLVSLGQHGNARASFQKARRLFKSLGEVSSSAVMWAASGRLAMRDGRYDEARSSFSAALEQYVQSADIANQANLLLSLGELSRLEENFDGAESALVRVTQLAQSLEDQQLEGRAYTALAALNLQMLSLDAAESHYAKALELAEACGDQKMSSYIQIGLGEVQSRMESDEALGSIVRGAQGFASLGHEHGMGAAMLRLAQHSIRIGRPVLALVAAESSRRFWRRSDPVRGVGQSLRIIVKALAALKRWESLLFVAKARVLIAGSLQHNSVDVLEFYVDKAPDEWLERMSAMSDKVLIDRAEQEIAGVISELLPDGEQGLNKLGTILGGMSTIESILMNENDSVVESVESVQLVEQSKGEIA